MLLGNNDFVKRSGKQIKKSLRTQDRKLSFACNWEMSG